MSMAFEYKEPSGETRELIRMVIKFPFYAHAVVRFYHSKEAADDAEHSARALGSEILERQEYQRKE